MVSSKRLIFTQQIAFFDFSSVDLSSLLAGLKGSPKWAWILHDKDDSEKHIHVYLEYDKQKNSGSLVKELAVLNVPEPAIEYAKSKVGCLGYLTHSTDKAKSKHQYSADEIHSNFDVATEWKQEAEKMKTKDDYLSEFDSMLQSGLCRTVSDFKIEIAPVLYAKYATEIKRLCECYLERAKSMDAEKVVYFISGLSGSGKTEYSKHLAKKNYGSSVYISDGGERPLDSYDGEKCIVLNEMRGGMLTYRDWLALLDNTTNSKIGARFQNKDMSNCQCIIINSIQGINEFVREANPTSEDSYQFFRRVSTYIVCDDWRIVNKSLATLKIDVYSLSTETKKMEMLKPGVPVQWDITYFDHRAHSLAMLGLDSD